MDHKEGHGHSPRGTSNAETVCEIWNGSEHTRRGRAGSQCRAVKVVVTFALTAGECYSMRARKITVYCHARVMAVTRRKAA